MSKEGGIEGGEENMRIGAREDWGSNTGPIMSHLTITEGTLMNDVGALESSFSFC